MRAQSALISFGSHDPLGFAVTVVAAFLAFLLYVMEGMFGACFAP